MRSIGFATPDHVLEFHIIQALVDVTERKPVWCLVFNDECGDAILRSECLCYRRRIDLHEDGKIVLFLRKLRPPILLGQSSWTILPRRPWPVGVVTVVADYRIPTFVLCPPPAVVLAESVSVILEAYRALQMEFPSKYSVIVQYLMIKDTGSSTV